MQLKANWTIADLWKDGDAGGRYWDASEPYSVFSGHGQTSGPICSYVGGTMIDCRIPVEARKPMALGEEPVLTYAEWKAKAGIAPA